jgi:predicted dienelactone hydrolase
LDLRSLFTVPRIARPRRLASQRGHRALSSLAFAVFALGLRPARAVEVLQLRLPLLDDTLSARVSELASPEALWAGNSDLAELNRATNGNFAAAIEDLVNYPLPQQDYQGSAMVQQMEVLLKQLIEVDPGVKGITDPEPVRSALIRLKASGQKATLLSLLREIPGHKVTIRLDRAVPQLRRIERQQREVDRLLLTYPKLPPAKAANLARGRWPIQTRVSTIVEPYSHEQLEVTVVRPVGTPTLPPVVISHGLWDSPASFLGWAQYLASHGAPVFLPRHPGSDISQQAEMLAGKAPPPDPKEFLRRPRDVRAVLDALDAGTLAGGEGVQARAVTFIGHSWGGTTALQLAGARSLPTGLWKDCANAVSPLRNSSWVLQCSFLPAATDASLADPRIVRVAAVSPPQGLVFAAGLVDLKVPVLLVTGTRDFVVPTRPEALLPYGAYPHARNDLVLAEGGTHFNLPADASSNGGPLRVLLLRWVQGHGITPTSAVSDPKDLPLRLIPSAGTREH